MVTFLKNDGRPAGISFSWGTPTRPTAPPGQAMLTALSIARPGGAVGRVGVPQEDEIPAGRPSFFKNVTIAGGPAPVRAYIEELMPDVLEGRIQPGRVFDQVTDLDGVPAGYRAMNERTAIKVMIAF